MVTGCGRNSTCNHSNTSTVTPEYGWLSLQISSQANTFHLEKLKVGYRRKLATQVKGFTRHFSYNALLLMCANIESDCSLVADKLLARVEQELKHLQRRKASMTEDSTSSSHPQPQSHGTATPLSGSNGGNEVIYNQ